MVGRVLAEELAEPEGVPELLLDLGRPEPPRQEQRPAERRGELQLVLHPLA
jgi:hypothetical protein